MTTLPKRFLLALCVTAALTACGGQQTASLDSSVLQGGGNKYAWRPVAVGARVALSCDFSNAGSTPLRVQKAQVVGLAPHLHVDAVGSVDRRVHGNLLASPALDFALGPVSNIVLPPQQKASDWYLMTVLYADAPGTFSARGLKITVADPAGQTVSKTFPCPLSMTAQSA